MKAKLKARRRRKVREQNPTAAAQANGPQSIFEEIKDLLKEEERSKSTRWGDAQRQDNYDREQEFYTRSYDGSSTSSSRSRDVVGDPYSPINKIIKELQSLEMKIDLDERDWGDVTDQELIEERLRDLYDM